MRRPLEIRWGRHCYQQGFWFRGGRWAYIGRRLRVNKGYFLGIL